MLVRCCRVKLSVWAALCVLVLGWFYVFPAYRLPSDKEIVEEVLGLGEAWKKNQTGIDLYRNLLTECCNPRWMFAVTKENAPIGKVLWYDGEYYYSHTVNNETYSVFVQVNQFVKGSTQCSNIECNLPPLTKEYLEDVGNKTHLVTANPSIIEKRFQGLLWSRKAFVDYLKAYGSSFIYMPAFSMKPGTDPSLRAYYAVTDSHSNLTMLFANPDFLRNVGKFWKARGVHAKRLSTGLFLVSLALGMCDEVTVYGFWPFSIGLDGQPISHHYYDNILPGKWFHAMPEEFVQLWHLHKSGTLRVKVGSCQPQNEGS
uniref:Alpha-N-acetylneuraminide alpha-2,8-sialyltransferase n=1 Tax=Xiphophorus couchianus TaxID=32473 RepID=A0A3B5M1K4_9TELE